MNSLVQEGQYIPSDIPERNIRFDLTDEAKSLEKNDALRTQVGGKHYKNFMIQPIEFTMINKLNFCQGNIIKYVCRYKTKNGIEDLKKAKHYIDLLIQLEYGDDTSNQR